MTSAHNGKTLAAHTNGAAIAPAANKQAPNRLQTLLLGAWPCCCKRRHGPAEVPTKPAGKVHADSEAGKTGNRNTRHRLRTWPPSEVPPPDSSSTAARVAKDDCNVACGGRHSGRSVEGLGDNEEDQEVLKKLDTFVDVLRERGGPQGLAGLPHYQGSDGSEMPVGESPLFTDESLARFLLQARGDCAVAADRVLDTLMWRQRVMPSTKDAPTLHLTWPVRLLEERQRFRCLGPNLDGDLVFATHFQWGHFVAKGATDLDMVRMIIVASEEAMMLADACGHPQIVLITSGGPAPYNIGRVLNRIMESRYPRRLKRGIVYPVPPVFTYLVYAAFFFMKQGTREKFSITSEEADVVEFARLTSREQLPEDWRGGYETVKEAQGMDESLVVSTAMQYLNPLGGSAMDLEAALEGPWEAPPEAEAATASRPPREQLRQRRPCRDNETMPDRLQNWGWVPPEARLAATSGAAVVADSIADEATLRASQAETARTRAQNTAVHLAARQTWQDNPAGADTARATVLAGGAGLLAFFYPREMVTGLVTSAVGGMASAVGPVNSDADEEEEVSSWCASQ